MPGNDGSLELIDGIFSGKDDGGVFGLRRIGPVECVQKPYIHTYSAVGPV